MKPVLSLVLVLLVAHWPGPARGSEPPGPEKPLGQWIEALQAADSARRHEAAVAVGRLGPRAEAATEPLLRALTTDSDPNVRAAAAEALGNIGQTSPEVLEALHESLKDAGWTDDDYPVWAVVSRSLGELGPAAVPRLTKALEAQQNQVRRGAAMALSVVGPQAQAAVPALIRLLEQDPQARREAIGALAAIGPAAEPAVPRLIEALEDDEDFHVQYWAARALGQIGPAARAALPALIGQLEQGTASVRRNAATALGKLGPEFADQTVPALARRLKDHNQVVREDAVIALGNLGPAARGAAPDILQALEDPQFAPRIQAAEALWRVDPQQVARAVAVLVEQLDDETAPWAAAEALGQIGPEAKTAVPALTKRLDDPEPYTRLWAAQALGSIGPAAQVALPQLAPLKNDPDPDVQAAAQHAIGQIQGQPE